MITTKISELLSRKHHFSNYTENAPSTNGQLPPAGLTGNALRRNSTKRNETVLNTAIALKSLANHLSTSNLKRRRAATKKKQASVESSKGPPAFKTRPGTPSRQLQSNGKISAYKFLRRSSKVTPSSCDAAAAAMAVNQTSSSSTLPPLQTNSRKNSKASELLATIPVCGLQKCLVKYGCGHCL